MIYYFCRLVATEIIDTSWMIVIVWQGILTTLSQTSGGYNYDYATVPFLAEVLKVETTTGHSYFNFHISCKAIVIGVVQLFTAAVASFRYSVLFYLLDLKICSVPIERIDLWYCSFLKIYNERYLLFYNSFGAVLYLWLSTVEGDEITAIYSSHNKLE